MDGYMTYRSPSPPTTIDIVVSFLSPFANSKPDNANNANTKSKDEPNHDQDIPIIVAKLKSKELYLKKRKTNREIFN